MKRILNLLVLLMAMTSSTFAAGNISLSVSDMQYGWGGSADATENSITVGNYANNYWTVNNLSTDDYTSLEIVFAQLRPAGPSVPAPCTWTEPRPHERWSRQEIR